MQAACDQLLTDAALAPDQHGDVSGGHPLDCLVHRTHGHTVRQRLIGARRYRTDTMITGPHCGTFSPAWGSSSAKKVAHGQPSLADGRPATRPASSRPTGYDSVTSLECGTGAIDRRVRSSRRRG